MLWTLIRKEWTNNLLELRFLVCAALCVILALVSVMVLHADLAAKRADFHAKDLTAVDQRNLKLVRSVEDSHGGPLSDAAHGDAIGWLGGA